MSGRIGNYFKAWFGLIWFYIHPRRYRKHFFTYTIVVLLCGISYAVGYLVADYRYQEFEFALNRIGQELGLDWHEESSFVKFAMVKREMDVSARTVDQLRQFLYEKTRDLEDLKEQLYFYKSVITPEEVQEGLSIFSVDVSAPRSDAGSYPIEIVLRKIGKKSDLVKGRIQISAYGSQNNRHTSISNLDKGEVKFSFKYFQRIRSVISLPEEFVPEQLIITVISGKFKQFEQKFSWQEIV